MSETILNLSYNDAKEYFLKNENYTTLKLPEYFTFERLLKSIDEEINNENDLDKRIKFNDKLKWKTGLSYKIICEKNDRYNSREMSLIHPELYVILVKIITSQESWELIKKKFEEFQANKNIICSSIPKISNNKNKERTEINSWWEKFEQESIENSSNYKYLAITDIKNFYPSIYTHSFGWVFNGKEESKAKGKGKNKNDNLGDLIDSILRNMSYGQTNGIPQGSSLMDFLSEMILGYADYQLSKELEKYEKLTDYKILRYRDDYRIFAKTEKDLSIILKNLTQTLLELNLHLNEQKTKITTNIIPNLIKEDKIYVLGKQTYTGILYKDLLLIKKIGAKYPNCGTLKKLLSELKDRLMKQEYQYTKNIDVCIAIITDIMYDNIGTIPFCVSILSVLLEEKFKCGEDIFIIIDKIKKKFEDRIFIDYLNIWLQRLTILYKRDIEYHDTKLCELLYKEIKDVGIWYELQGKSKEDNELKNLNKEKVSLIIDEDKINKISRIIPNQSPYNIY